MTLTPWIVAKRVCIDSVPSALAQITESGQYARWSLVWFRPSPETNNALHPVNCSELHLLSITGIQRVIPLIIEVN